MKRLLLGATALAGLLSLASPASADVLLNLSPVAAHTVGPQSTSNPCIICATNAQQPAGFGYNNFTENGGIATYNMFSDALVSRDHAPDGVQNESGQDYTAGFLDTFIQANFNPSLRFGVAIDVNTAGGANGHLETLNSFQLIDVTQGTILAHYTGPTVIGTVADNGNGFADWLLTGFDLSGVNAGDNLIFHANWDHAT